MSKKSKHKPGDIVNVWNLTPSGKKIIEGKAKLLNFHKILTDGQEYWEVEFVSDNFVCDRIID